MNADVSVISEGESLLEPMVTRVPLHELSDHSCVSYPTYLRVGVDCDCTRICSDQMVCPFVYNSRMLTSRVQQIAQYRQRSFG